MAIDKEFLRSEKSLIFARLQRALNACYANPCNETQLKTFDELVYAYIYNLDLHVPVDFTGKHPTYMLLYHPKGFRLYQACTTPEELVKCSNTGSVIMSFRNLFKPVVSDSLPGLVLDPKSGHDTVFFMTRENIQKIIEYALQSINAQPEEVKNFLLNEI